MQDPDGSWRLSAYFSYDTGKRVGLAFNQMLRAYRNDACLNGIDPASLIAQPRGLPLLRSRTWRNLADALGLGPSTRKGVGVRIPPSAPHGQLAAE